MDVFGGSSAAGLTTTMTGAQVSYGETISKGNNLVSISILGTELPLWAIPLIVLAAVLVIVFLTCCIICCKTRYPYRETLSYSKHISHNQAFFKAKIMPVCRFDFEA